MNKTKNQIYLGIMIIALGVIMTSAMQGIPRPLGLVFMIIGGVMLFLGLKKKKQEEESDSGT